MSVPHHRFYVDGSATVLTCRSHKNVQDVLIQEDEERGQQKPQQTPGSYAGCDLLFEDDDIDELENDIKEHKFHPEPYTQQGQNDIRYQRCHEEGHEKLCVFTGHCKLLYCFVSCLNCAGVHCYNIGEMS